MASVQPVDFHRRRFLKLMAASMALASGACSGPPEQEIVPYLRRPEGAGEPLFYATAMELGGYARGVLAQTVDGRPIKIEGNPLHPASLGATDVYAQASVLQLWDPARSQAVLNHRRIASWQDCAAALADAAARLEQRRGEGLRLLTGTLTSPTITALVERVLQRYPEARWHRHDPLGDEAAMAGARLAFGRLVDTVHRFDGARVVLALDADFLADFPGSLRYARDYAAGRRPGPDMSRLYVVQSSPTLAGAAADHCLPLAPAAMEALLGRLAAGLDGMPVSSPWEAALLEDLRRFPGESLIVPGRTLSSAAHALAHVLNHRLGGRGRTFDHLPPVAGELRPTLADLAADMAEGQVETLLLLGGNPVYDAPADLEFAAALTRVPLSLHLSEYADETSQLATWHVPLAHYLEQWGDARAYDGTVSLVQPAIAPLYGGRGAPDVLAPFLGLASLSPYDALRDYWRSRAGADFDAWWSETLRLGLVPGSASAPLALTPRPAPPLPAAPTAPWQLAFAADAAVRGGEFAPNAWLQELPRPHTTLTWDNAAHLGPASAAKLGVATGDVVELLAGGRRLRAPVWVHPAQAEGVVTLPLGYGRVAAGPVGSRVGCNAYFLRQSGAPWIAPVEIRPTVERHAFAVRQPHADMEGRDPVRVVPLSGANQAPAPKRESPSLYPGYAYPDHAWAMSIDLNACIGCGACTLACQAENNIPVVGPEEVAKGRAMHWIRVDRYEERGRTLFQPVPCMHCEKAPCEEVCPVGATVHDHQGLNLQVYNRCVGTRFCSNNCPYKVRRFNFLQYSESTPEAAARNNPEVTVRGRGVMEKCTYCVQRIQRARIVAEGEGRRIEDGEVVTACQAVCPTRAIVFGDLNDPGSAVRAAKASPRRYVLLEELDTRPRTTYLSRVSNRHPRLES